MNNYNCSVVGISKNNGIANFIDIFVEEDEYIARGKAESKFKKAFPNYDISFVIVDFIDIVQCLDGSLRAKTTKVL